MMKVSRAYIFFLVKFLGLFGILFYGTEVIIGLSTPDNVYNEFVARNLNFIDPFRHFQLLLVRDVVSVFGYQTYFRDSFWLSVVGGRGVRMAYDCIGYGVLSFWVAFVFANKGTWKKKMAWMVGGCIALVAINIARISLLLVAINKGWPIPFGWDHHTWFNIISYILIFTMIYFFDRNGKMKKTKDSEGDGNQIWQTREKQLI
ncbi:exosortase/archaeosortase family protein [Flavisolibacter nicotianae]|uniref:exosortase/archaeosortase family protein n=1 Tax=Flavisolibacter nicotianae TaxID=2364882 RepID=UPI000EB4C5E0|nr:exosortase/archaeosortase family protein [Flavisolibacter nicotianae]